MNSKRALAASAVLSFLSSVAFAADLPTTKGAPPPPPSAPVAYDWSGFYLGGYAGAAFGSARLHDVPFPSFSNNNSLSGFTGGGLAGYNYQIGSLVLGAEGEFGYDGARGSQGFFTIAGLPRKETFEQSYIGRIRGRVGYAFDRWQFFAAGGVSFADAKVTLDHSDTGLTKSNDQNRTGFNVGGGVEYAFTRNWIGRVEYIYDGFGKQTYVFDPAAGFDTRSVSASESTVRAAIEYKF